MDGRAEGETQFGMILTKEEAALIMALRHVPEVKIGRVLELADVGMSRLLELKDASINTSLEAKRMGRVFDIYNIKILHGLGVTV